MLAFLRSSVVSENSGQAILVFFGLIWDGETRAQVSQKNPAWYKIATLLAKGFFGRFTANLRQGEKMTSSIIDNPGNTIPEKTLDLGAICQVGEDIILKRPPLALMPDAFGTKVITADGYPINLDKALGNARALGVNLDGYLTAQVAYYMSTLDGRKAPILVWYVLRNNMAFLFFSSRKSMAGYNFEGMAEPRTEDALFSDAEPFMYYAGQAGNGDIFRVYYRCSAEEGDYLLYDMGAYGAYRLSGSPESEGYDRVVQNPLGEDDIFYTPVPWESSFVVKWKGRPITVKRALCRLKFGDVVLP